jgi:hypothetical protein
MTEYRDELEQMLFQLPLAGSAFKKVYYDPIYERPVSAFIPAEDFVVSYGASDLHGLRALHPRDEESSDIEVMKLQMAGFYRDVELPDPAPEIVRHPEAKYNDLAGRGRRHRRR